MSRQIISNSIRLAIHGADKSPFHPTLEEVWGMSGFGTVLIGPSLGRFYKLIKKKAECIIYSETLFFFFFLIKSQKSLLQNVYKHFLTMCMNVQDIKYVTEYKHSIATHNPWSKQTKTMLLSLKVFKKLKNQNTTWAKIIIFCQFSEVFVGV